MRLRRELKAYIEAELRDYYQTKIDLIEAKADLILQAPVTDCTVITSMVVSNQFAAILHSRIRNGIAPN